MENSIEEPLRPTFNLKSDEASKWKKIGFIFIIISNALLIALIIISILAVKSKDDDENEDEEEKGKDDKEKYDWAPAGDRIKKKGEKI